MAYSELYIASFLIFNVYIVFRTLWTKLKILIFLSFIVLSLIYVFVYGKWNMIILFKYSSIFYILLFDFKAYNNKSKLAFLSSVKYAFVVLSILGLYQFYKVLAGSLVLFEGHIRPIGLSVEPTWFSQQLFVLFFVILSSGIRISFIDRLLYLVNLVLTVTRTSILASILFSKYSLRGKLLFSVLLFGVFIFLGKIEMFTFIASKIDSVSGVEEEPRYLALVYMLNAVLSFPFGYGFSSYEHVQSGLIVGSNFGNLFLGLFYTYGIFISPFIIIILYSVFKGKKGQFNFIVFASIFFALFMPYLFSFFGLFFVFVSKSISN